MMRIGRVRRVTIGAGVGVLLLAQVMVATPGQSVPSSRVVAEPDCSAAAVASTMQKTCFSLRLSDGVRPARATAAAATSAAAASYGYGPSDLQSAYQVPATTAAPTVAIVDAFGDSTIEADLAQYRTEFGLPPCTVDSGCLQVVNQRGDATLPTDPQGGAAGWRDETALDVEMVSALCPSCHILLVQSDSSDSSGHPDLETGVQTAVSLGARVVSMSWGGAEWRDESAFDQQYLSTPGVAYVAASGDSGYGTSWPAVSPAAIAVGGTSLYADNSPRGYSEAAWGNYTGATGSGCSTFEPMAGWQTKTAAGPACYSDHRAQSDLAMDADPQTGVAVYSQGAWGTFGGTSASAPMVAALVALAGNLDPRYPATVDTPTGRRPGRSPTSRSGTTEHARPPGCARPWRAGTGRPAWAARSGCPASATHRHQRSPSPHRPTRTCCSIAMTESFWGPRTVWACRSPTAAPA